MLSALWERLGETLYDPSPTVERNLKKSCTENGVNFNMEVALPLGVHGDGVPNQAHKTIVAFTWNILGSYSERILFAALSKDPRSRTFRNQWEPKVLRCTCQLVLFSLWGLKWTIGVSRFT